MKQPSNILKFLMISFILGVLTACGTDDNDDDNGNNDTNQAPVISGTPATTVNEGSLYHFAPTASDGDSGDTLTFSITNKPAWASFNNQTGVLDGTPSLDDANDYSDIKISVSDGIASAQLAAFTIMVVDVIQSLAVNTHSPTTQAIGIPLHDNITITLDALLDAATVTDTSVILQGTGDTNISTTLSTENQIITIDPVSDLAPLTTYTVIVTTAVTSTNGAVLDSDYSWRFTTLTSAASAPPLLLEWEAKMLTYGEHWGQYLTNLYPAPGTFNEQNMTYYDSQRVFYQIAEYTDQQEPWYSYAQEAKRIYLNYAANRIHNWSGLDYSIPAYRRFSHGLYMGWLRTGNAGAAESIVKLRDNPAFSNPEQIPQRYTLIWSNMSRAVAYALSSHVMAEKAGNPRITAHIPEFVAAALNHINEWVTGIRENPDTSTHRFAPFMAGLTAEALIDYYEWEIEQGRTPDNTIPDALKQLADYLWTATVFEGVNQGNSMWVADIGGTGYPYNDQGGTGVGAFRYEDRENPISSIDGSGLLSPELNLLIAPLYAWVFNHYGDTTYIERGDLIWEGGIALANVAWNTKIFNQNYRWSFDYIKWRNEGFVKWPQVDND